LNPKLCYIDIFDCLSLDDYYRTDTHWRQEAIFPVANRLVQAMGGVVLPSREDYQQQRLYPFYGVYCGQSALPVPPDELIYLSADSTAQSVVRSVEEPGQFPVYTVDKFTGLDGYDVFLSGPSALLTIENPVAATERELVLFRDSFASSLTPLLLANYAKITLVDLRYFAASLLGDYVQFTDADVLFLYSTSLINNGSLLK
ncbi:MAG: DHHW family protein, partial [Clostridiales bacterium]